MAAPQLSRMAVIGHRELRILSEVAQALNRSSDEESALNRTLTLIAEHLGFETGWVWLQEVHSRRFYLAGSRNLPPYLQEPVRMTGSVCWCLEAFLDGDFVTKNVDAIECSRLRPAVRKRETALTGGIAYHASVVLRSGERQLGILNLTAPGFKKVSGEELRLLSTIGLQVGIAVDRARLAEQERDIARLQERASLARDLHDTFAQDLTAITLQLEAALHSIQGTNEGVRAPVQRALDVARQNVHRARESVDHLRRGALQGRTLQTAIAEHARSFTSQTGVPVHLELPSIVLDPANETQLFSILIEGLTNVRRHAKARHASVELTASPQNVTLRISDDGLGYRRTKYGRHFGLVGMKERAHTMGGTFTIRQNLPHGTAIVVKVPRR